MTNSNKAELLIISAIIIIMISLVILLIKSYNTELNAEQLKTAYEKFEAQLQDDSCQKDYSNMMISLQFKSYKAALENAKLADKSCELTVQKLDVSNDGIKYPRGLTKEAEDKFTQIHYAFYRVYADMRVNANQAIFPLVGIAVSGVSDKELKKINKILSADKEWTQSSLNKAKELSKQYRIELGIE